MRTFGARLKSWRVEAGHTQESLASAVSEILGDRTIRRADIAAYETERRWLNDDEESFAAFAQALRLPVRKFRNAVWADYLERNPSLRCYVNDSIKEGLGLKQGQPQLSRGEALLIERLRDLQRNQVSTSQQDEVALSLARLVTKASALIVRANPRQPDPAAHFTEILRRVADFPHGVFERFIATTFSTAVLAEKAAKYGRQMAEMDKLYGPVPDDESPGLGAASRSLLSLSGEE